MVLAITDVLQYLEKRAFMPRFAIDYHAVHVKDDGLHDAAALDLVVGVMKCISINDRKSEHRLSKLNDPFKLCAG